MRLPSPALTAPLITVLTAGLLLSTSACSKESDRAADRTRSSASPSATATTTAPGASGTPTGASYPAFTPQDYRYQLEVLCYCPQVGTVQVVVQDGEVADATSIDGPSAGQPAPDFARLTIDDIITMANDPAVAKANVEWPDGQDHPSSVMLDRIAQAVDDEVTYTIASVQVTPAG